MCRRIMVFLLLGCRVVTESNRIISVGQDLYDHQVQPLANHHIVSYSIALGATSTLRLLR